MCVQDVDVQCVLQFTLINAAGCALHRRTSRVIHRIELYLHPVRSTWVRPRHGGNVPSAAGSTEAGPGSFTTVSEGKHWGGQRPGGESPRCVDGAAARSSSSNLTPERFGRYPSHQVWNSDPGAERRRTHTPRAICRAIWPRGTEAPGTRRRHPRAERGRTPMIKGCPGKELPLAPSGRARIR